MTMPFSSAASRATTTGRAVVVRAVAGNIDHAPQAPMRVLVEQRHGEIDRARDRGARRAADRGLHDFSGDGVRRLGPVDQAPRDDDFLVGGGRPLEIGHRDLAVRAVLQRLQKFLGDDGLRVAFALQREFVHVHRIGDIDGEDEFDVDGRIGFLVGQLTAGGVGWWPGRFAGSGAAKLATSRRRVRPQQARPRSRHTSALRPSRRMTVMVTCKMVDAKR